MNRRQIVKLSDVCRIESGGTPSSSNSSYWDGDIPWVTLVDVKNKYVESTNRKISLSGLNNSSAKILPLGTVLFSSRATIGSVSIAKIELATNQGFKNFICDKNKLIPEYLYYYLKNEAANIEASCPGTTYKEISKSKIEKYTIPLPLLADQKRIVKILDQADVLRQKRKQTIGVLDDYLKSVFIEMFGDPVKNPKGWNITPIIKISQKITDGEHLNPQFVDNGMPMIMAGNVLENTVDLANSKKIPLEKGILFRKKCNPERFDILLVSRGATIGRLCRVDTTESFCLMGSVILIKPDTKVLNSAFLTAQLKQPSIYHKLFNSSGSSAQQAIYLKDVKKLSCILPPLQLQNQFADIVEKTESLKQKMITQSEELENQFQALMQKAFKGTL